MFNRGRPKNHAHIAFFTYEGPDGTVITYEMTNKGLLKQICNSPKISLQQVPRTFTDDCQKEIKVNENNETFQSDTSLSYSKDQLSMHHSFSNHNLNSININNGSDYIEEQNIPDMFNDDFLLYNNPFDEDFFNSETFLKDEPKIDNTQNNQYFGGLADYPNTEFKPGVDENFF